LLGNDPQFMLAPLQADEGDLVAKNRILQAEAP
jgi:hypothetical protein